jgi:hypothetical protein
MVKGTQPILVRWHSPFVRIELRFLERDDFHRPQLTLSPANTGPS